MEYFINLIHVPRHCFLNYSLIMEEIFIYFLAENVSRGNYVQYASLYTVLDHSIRCSYTQRAVDWGAVIIWPRVHISSEHLENVAS